MEINLPKDFQAEWMSIDFTNILFKFIKIHQLFEKKLNKKISFKKEINLKLQKRYWGHLRLMFVLAGLVLAFSGW